MKLWLVWLNAVLLGAVLFLEDPLARLTLASLVPAVVILGGIAMWHGGLVRLLGLGHLIPWLPLLAYVELRLLTDWAGPRITWGADPALFAWAVVPRDHALGVPAARRVGRGALVAWRALRARDRDGLPGRRLPTLPGAGRTRPAVRPGIIRRLVRSKQMGSVSRRRDDRTPNGRYLAD